MSGVYRNDGARWTRPDGTVIGPGEEFIPTEDERLRKAYKLTYLRPADSEDASSDSAEPSPPERGDLEDYAVGGGWYLIHGEKVQGRIAALTALEEAEDD